MGSIGRKVKEDLYQQKDSKKVEGMAMESPFKLRYLTLPQLESHLWKAADILRGSVNATDYKRYILPLLFLKRISDRWDEEKEKGQPHQFQVPKESHWKSIANCKDDLGEAINRALTALEDANPTLQGILARTNFADHHRLPPTTLRRLVDHFSTISLRDEDLITPDLLGRAYEYLLKQFAKPKGRKGGEFYTPREVVRLMVSLLDPKEGMSICDPTCGTGGMLLECALYVKQNGEDPQKLVLHGQEKNPDTWAMCKMNMLLHGLNYASIELGDTIREPNLVENGKLITYDIVIANPPFSLKEWGDDFATRDPFGRFRYGIPPKSFGDLAFIQHMIAILKPTGKMAVVVPHGVLFRGNSEAEIRKGIIEDDLLEAVIGLPDKLFYNTGIPTAILVINKAKPKGRKGKVLFIDASKDFEAKRNQNVLREKDIEKIVQAFKYFKNQEGYTKVVSLSEIRRNGYNLNISRYMIPAGGDDSVDLSALWEELQALESERAELFKSLEKVMQVLTERRV
ncbi:MAG: type I restriction-modification system subunit M [Caldisericaceae bacterium]